MKRLALILMLLGASCASLTLPETALAVATTKVALTSTAWTDLGVGPLQLNSGGTQIYYSIADTTPPLPAVGFAVPPNTNQIVNTATHVWAISAAPGAASVVVAPVAGTSGSGGTFTWPGSATVTTYGVAPVGTVPAVNAYVTNSVGGSGSGFLSSLSYSTSTSVTTASTPIAFPAGATTGSVIKVYNRGPNPVYWTYGPGTPTATTAMAQLDPYAWDSFVVHAGDTTFAGITGVSGQTATINMELGAGNPNGTGGPINQAVTAGGVTSVFYDVAGGLDNTNLARAMQVTAPGTPAANGFLGIQGCPTCTPVPVSGSFGVTIGGFTPSTSGARMPPLSVGLTDSTATLPTGTAVVVGNTDVTNPIYCNVNGVAATVADQKIPKDSWFGFTIPVGQTTLHCIATGGTVIANGVGGVGLPTGAGGGGGSVGGGPATIADGADVTQGAKADTAWTSGSGSVIALLKAAVGGINAPEVSTIADGADVTQGAKADAAWVSGAGSEVAILKAISAGVLSGYDAASNTKRVSSSPYPAGATPITASTVGTTAATTATLSAVAGKTTYICGYSIRVNANAVATGNAQVTGTISGTLNFTQWTAPNASGLGVSEQVFLPCVPASTVNIGISITSAPAGAGGVVSVSAWGFQI